MAKQKQNKKIEPTINEDIKFDSDNMTFNRFKVELVKTKRFNVLFKNEGEFEKGVGVEFSDGTIILSDGTISLPIKKFKHILEKQIKEKRKYFKVNFDEDEIDMVLYGFDYKERINKEIFKKKNGKAKTKQKKE